MMKAHTAHSNNKLSTLGCNQNSVVTFDRSLTQFSFMRKSQIHKIIFHSTKYEQKNTQNTKKEFVVYDDFLF